MYVRFDIRLCCVAMLYCASCFLCLLFLCFDLICRTVPCRAVPCRAVVCCSCAVLCCAVLCCVVLCCAVLYCALLCCTLFCCVVLRCAVLCCAVLCCAVLCCAVLRCAVLVSRFGFCFPLLCLIPSEPLNLLLLRWLSGNPFVCNQKLQWLQTWAQEKNNVTKDIDSVMCRMQNGSLAKLMAYNFTGE